MAVGEAIPGASGTGTALDPYIPTNFASFISAVGTAQAYVCLLQDIDVSHDAVYKTGITSPVAINCTYLYGTAKTFDMSVTYNKDDVCTFNDGENGLRTYTCQADGVVGIDVSDTTYWTPGGDPTKKITGLIVTSTYFIRAPGSGMSGTINVSNIFFESCVFYKTSVQTSLFGVSNSSHNPTFSDCIFSFLYIQHLYTPAITDMSSSNFDMYFNRCSFYIKYSHDPIEGLYGSNSSANLLSSKTHATNCTFDLDNFCTYLSTSTTTYSIGGSNVSMCSFRITASLIKASSNSSSGTFRINGTTSCFYAVSIIGVSDTSIPWYIAFSGLSGVNIVDSEVVGNLATVNSATNLITGTTAQCKDKDWLISQGFLTS